MRYAAMTFALWASVLHLQLPIEEQFLPVDSPTSLLAVAATLAGLTVMVYRLGVWRQEMENTKHNIGGEVARLREETSANFAALDRRFTTIDQFIAAATEQRVAAERWQGRADSTIATHEREMGALGTRLTRLEGGTREEAA